jgi:membrane protein implicated in regulation of membrane protease activity
MNPTVRRWLFIMPQDWTWWVWLVMACLLLIGLVGLPKGFLAALLLSSAQSVLFLARERAVKAFSVQLRLATRCC